MIIRHVYENKLTGYTEVWYTETHKKKKLWNPLDPNTFIRKYGLHPWNQCFPPGMFKQLMNKWNKEHAS